MGRRGSSFGTILPIRRSQIDADNPPSAQKRMGVRFDRGPSPASDSYFFAKLVHSDSLCISAQLPELRICRRPFNPACYSVPTINDRWHLALALASGYVFHVNDSSAEPLRLDFCENWVRRFFFMFEPDFTRSTLGSAIRFNCSCLIASQTSGGS